MNVLGILLIASIYCPVGLFAAFGYVHIGVDLQMIIFGGLLGIVIGSIVSIPLISVLFSVTILAAITPAAITFCLGICFFLMFFSFFAVIMIALK